MFEWQAAEPFLVAGSQTVKCAVCEHTSTLWLTSDALTLSTAMSVQERAPSSSLESYTGCSRLPLLCRYRSTHLATQFTPANFRACNFTGQQIQLTEKGTSYTPSLLRPEVLLTQTVPKCLSAVRNHSPERTSLPFCLPYKRQNMQDKSSSTSFYSAKQRIIQFSPCRGTKLLPGEISPRGRMEGVLATRRDKAGGGVQAGCSSRVCLSVSPVVSWVSAHLEERSTQVQRPIPNWNIFCSTSHIGHL